ncbi:MAG: TAXI family TRAP transporter solute-binding subunit [Melioribacteraceae bacterium]
MSLINNINKLLIAGVFIALLAITAFFAWNYFNQDSSKHLVIGAGSKKGEAYKFAQAIAEVTSRHFPDVHITVKQTAGSKENMELLESGQIDLATVQADIEAVPSARIISNLYPDMFQLIVRKDANINSFHDLKGKRMALPSKGGGQWISFWFTANHYGIFQSDITNIALSSTAAVDAIINGEIDAVFKVRAPRNQTIMNILSSCPSKLIPINQATAMKLKQPSLNVGSIPMGAYLGDPLVPEKDLATVAVNRLLIGHKNADNEAVRLVSKILFERRLELLKITPLAGFISQPDWGAGTFIPIHDGARSFFDREKPSYFVENADFVALIMSLLIMFGSTLLGLRKKASGNQKNLADKHTKELITIMESVNENEELNISFINEKRNILQTMLAEVINKLDNDQLTAEGFQFFSFTWDKAYDLLRQKESGLI